jgi:hypothetical protein
MARDKARSQASVEEPHGVTTQKTPFFNISEIHCTFKNYDGRSKSLKILLQMENERYERVHTVMAGSSACLLAGATGVDRFWHAVKFMLNLSQT